jgi:hypothetical protein
MPAYPKVPKGGLLVAEIDGQQEFAPMLIFSNWLLKMIRLHLILLSVDGIYGGERRPVSSQPGASGA